ncbi:unnamed protein product, partial [Iphiclides podalirius]
MEELWKDSNILYNILCFLITENEKLFDRSDSRLYWKTVFHAFSIVHHVYISLFSLNLELENHPHVEVQALYTFRAAYLTGWNFAFQTLFLTLSLANDVLEWFDKHENHLAERLRYWRDVIFSGLVVPFTLFVSSMFWCVYAVDRELVFPKAYDNVVPWWFNHCVHTNISVVVLVETLLQARRRPRDFKKEISLVIIVDIAYAIVQAPRLALDITALYLRQGSKGWSILTQMASLFQFVSSMFWCVYAVDRELVFPKAYDNVVPWWFNHCVHTNISVVVLVETLLQARRRPRDFKKEISLVIIVDIAYAIVYYGIYAWTGRWLYQIFGIMNWWQVCLYQVLIWLSSFVFYCVQFPVNRLVHGEAEEAEEADAAGPGHVAEEVLTKEGPLEADKAPLPPKSWSLKYRTGRGQFENSHL